MPLKNENRYRIISHISVVMITRDAANVIEETLRKLSHFREVIIYDNGSRDTTLDIASKFPNVSLIQGTFDGFGPTKRRATQYASNNWIFFIDADEAPDSTLMEQLHHWPANTDPHKVGEVLRMNYLLGKQVKYAGWGNDWLVRLFHRKAYNYDASKVHEKIALDSKAIRARLSGVLIHQAVTDLNQFLEKINRYSDLRSTSPRRYYPPALIFLKSAFAFFRGYILRHGWLCGWRGLVIAVADANGVFWKYMKAHARREAGMRDLQNDD